MDYCYETQRMRWILSDICVDLGLLEMAENILGVPVGELDGFANKVYGAAVERGFPMLGAALVAEGFTYGV